MGDDLSNGLSESLSDGLFVIRGAVRRSEYRIENLVEWRLVKMVKRLLKVFLVASLLLGLGVCGLFASTGLAATQPVVLVIRTGPEADGLRVVAKEFTKETGIPVQINELGRQGYEYTITTQLVAGTDAFDVAFYPGWLIGEVVQAGALEPLNSFIAKSDPKKFDRDDLLVVYGLGDKIYALPTDVSVHFLYYRKDLIPDPPDTWDEYFEVAKKFTRSLNPKSPTAFGAGFSAHAGEEGPKIFSSVMWSMGGWIFDEKGNVGIDSPGAIAAGEYYVKLAKAGVISPDILSWSYPNVLDAMRAGTIAMAGPFWNAAYAEILNSDSPYRNSFAVTLVPGVKQKDGSILRTPFWHGWTLVMNAQSRRKQLAWEFLSYATGKHGGAIYARSGGGTPARRSVLGNPDLQKIRPEFALVLKTLDIARCEPVMPFYSSYSDAMNVAISQMLTGKAAPKDALREAGAKIRELLKKSGK